MKVFFIDPNNMTPQYSYPYLEKIQDKNCIDTYFYSTNYSDFTQYYDDNYYINASYIFSNKIASIKSKNLRKAVKFFSFPINYIQLLFKVIMGKPDIIHFNWLASPFWDYIFITIVKILRIKVVINIHNLIQHEKIKLRFFELKVFVKADQIVSLSKFTKNNLKVNLGLDSACIPHGNCYGKELGSLNNLTTRKDDGYFKLSFIGGVRPYKGIELLLKAISMLEFNIKLNIFGKSSPKYEKYLRLIIKNLGLTESVNFKNKFVSYKDLIENVTLCDLGVLPYQEATQSGVIYFFNSLKKPLLITDVGGLREQVCLKNSEIVNPNPISIKKGIINAKNKIVSKKYDIRNFDEININQNFNNTVKTFYLLYRDLI